MPRCQETQGDQARPAGHASSLQAAARALGSAGPLGSLAPARRSPAQTQQPPVPTSLMAGVSSLPSDHRSWPETHGQACRWSARPGDTCSWGQNTAGGFSARATWRAARTCTECVSTVPDGHSWASGRLARSKSSDHTRARQKRHTLPRSPGTQGISLAGGDGRPPNPSCGDGPCHSHHHFLVSADGKLRATQSLWGQGHQASGL